MDPMSKKVAAAKQSASNDAAGRGGRRGAGAAKKSNRQSATKVQSAYVGGYRVFGSIARPAHVTEQQIEDALASL